MPLFALDLHVLGTPPAFVLSQDQTLQLYFFEELNRRQHQACYSLKLADSYRCCRLRFAARPGWHRQRIDCGFRNLSSTWACYLVFKDRVACTPRDFLLPLLLLPPAVFNQRGCILYSSPHSLSTSTCASSGPLEVLSAAQWLPLFSFEGARLLPLRRLPCQPLPR